MWCWRILLKVPWIARRSNQSILKETSPEYSLEGLMLLARNSNTLATWCEELTHLKRPWCWERLRQEEKGTTEDEMVGWHHRLNGRGFFVDSGSWWWTGRPGMLWFMGSQRVGHYWATELNWYTLVVNSADSGAVDPRILEPWSSTKEFSKPPSLSTTYFPHLYSWI